MKKILLIALLFFVVQNSCTIEKRRYLSGYHIEWNSRSPKRADRTVPARPAMPAAATNDPAPAIREAAPPLPAAASPSGKPVVTDLRAQNEKLIRRATRGNPGQPVETIAVVSGLRVAASQAQAPQKEDGDGLLYFTSVLMVLSAMGLMRGGRKRINRLTRWAKVNPVKAQWLIAGLELPLLGLGLYTGHNLREMGYEMSGTTTSLFGALAVLGFLTVPFVSKRGPISLPKHVHRNRMKYFGITLASLMAMAGTGNQLADKYPNSPLASVMTYLDHTLIPASDTRDMNAEQRAAAKLQEQSQRKTVTGMSAGAAFIATFFLVILTCAGICLIIGGFAALGSGDPLGIAALLLGMLLLWLAIRGFESVNKKRNQAKTGTTP